MPRRTRLTEAAPADPKRQEAFRRGVSAEDDAAAFLVAQGFRILAQRWRSGAGEVDLVARREELLVFVEVKARARLETAAESVTPRQRGRIVAAAEAWLAGHPEDGACDVRFDAVLLAPGRAPVHLAAAFDASA